MIEFGKSLRDAREAKGYTIAQLSEITKLAPMTITELENADFSKIAAPIYGRGFIKIYCSAVGLEPKPFIDEFMDVINGNHPITIRERVTQESEAEAPAAPENEPATMPTAPSVADEPTAAVDSVAMELPINDEPTAANPPRLSRYAAPLHEWRNRASMIPPAFWRLALLGIVAVGIIWLLTIGIRALYQATSPTAATTNETEAVSETQPVPTAAPTPTKPKTPRTIQNIPRLYAD